MYPILIKVDSFITFGYEWGPIEVHSYGILIAIGFLFTVLFAFKFGKEDKIDPNFIFDLSFWLLVAGILGSRILFSIVNLKNYYNACFNPQIPNPLNANLPLDIPECYEIFKLWEGGLVWYGGLIAALFTGIYLCRKKGVSFALIADIGLGALPLGHFFGRIGCFMAGCCWGSVTGSFLGIRFPKDALVYKDAIVHGQITPHFPVHPTQLYEAAGLLCIFVILFFIRKKRKFYGQVALSYLIMYPILRSFLEIFRGDTSRGLIFEWDNKVMIDGIEYIQKSGISTSQITSLLVAAAALVWMRYLLKNRKKNQLHSHK